MEMTTLQYITSPVYGCSTTSELMNLSREDKANNTKNVEVLKEWARQEMQNKGITIK
jgi:hypothetical protein